MNNRKATQGMKNLKDKNLTREKSLNKREGRRKGIVLFWAFTVVISDV